MHNNLIIKTLLRVSRLLTTGQQRQGILLSLATVANAFLDALGLAAVLPVIAVALEPEMIQQQTLLKTVYDALGLTHPDQLLMLMTGVLLLVFCLKTGLGVGLTYWQSHFAMRIATDLSAREYARYIQAGYEVVKNTDSGNYISNVRNNPMILAQSVIIPLITLVAEVGIALIILTGITLYSPRLVIGLGLIMGACVWVIYSSTRRRSHRIGEALRNLAPKSIASLNESLQGFTDIVLLGKSGYFADRFLKLVRQENHHQANRTFLSQIPTRLTELIAILGILLVFSYTLLFAEARSDLFTLLGVFAIAAYRVLPSTNRILMAVVSIKTHLYTLDLVESRQIWPDYLPAAPSHRLPFEQGIRFEGVSYRFPDSVTPVLDQVTLEVKKGEAVGIIGESGSGKTTLMRILLRLYHETGGTVYVDQTPLRDDNREAWLAHIGYVQQHIFIQDGTVRENIAFGVSPEAISDEAVWQAVQLAGLQAFVTALPQGLDTPLGEFGNRLSGGQRQRVAIARALYRQADILVFDEATSALDAETEQMITASIRELAAAGKTLFIIAHRLTTLEGCSRIHELAQGVIVKTYDYDTLLREKLGLVREASPASSSLA